jgi:3-dehydroquinate synthase
MLIAASLSQRLGWLTVAEVGRIRELIRRAGLPLSAPRISATQALALMGMDKKVLGGRIRLVLLKGLGRAVVTTDYAPEALEATLREHFEGSSA